MTGRRIIWIIGGYIGIMFLALVLFYLLPIGNDSKDKMSEEEISQYFNEDFGLYDALKAGKLDSRYDKYRKEMKSYPFYEDQLKIISNGRNFGTNIYVEVKETNNHTVDVIQYQQKMIINSIDVDVSEKFDSLKVVLEGKQLGLLSPEQKKITFAIFDKDFTVTQFTGEKLFDKGFDVIGGNDFIYLRIPPNVQLIYDKDNVNLQFVNK